jgi:hypothetical protein
MLQRSKFNRWIVAGITAAAIAPATAIAQPAIDGGVGGGSGAKAQSLAAPDQVDRVSPATPSNGAPQWPANPRPIPNRHVATTNSPSNDGGIDGGVLIAIGGGALLAVGGLGLAGRKRLQAVRQQQLA